MRYFIWKMAGADCELLDQSSKDSQYSFKVIGLLYLLVFGLTFIGFTNLLFHVFFVNSAPYNQSSEFISALFLAAFLGFLISFLVGNIYRLILISLEPKTLPITQNNASLWLTNAVRITTVLVFAFFVGKSIEFLISFICHLGNYNEYLSGKILNYLIQVDRTEPWTWLFTILVCTIFVLPILLSQRLKRENDYYQIKKSRDEKLVKEFYKDFTYEKNRILKEIYKGYSKLQKEYFINDNAVFNRLKKDDELLGIKYFLENQKFQDHETDYDDPPFNTIKKYKTRKLKSQQEFLEAILNS